MSEGRPDSNVHKANLISSKAPYFHKLIGFVRSIDDRCICFDHYTYRRSSSLTMVWRWDDLVRTIDHLMRNFSSFHLRKWIKCKVSRGFAVFVKRSNRTWFVVDWDIARNIYLIMRTSRFIVGWGVAGLQVVDSVGGGSTREEVEEERDM